MKKISLMLMAIILSAAAVKAQNQLWAVTSDSTGDEDFVYANDLDNAGNSFTGGTYVDTLVIEGADYLNFVNDGTNDAFVVKYDQNGNALWVQTINGPGRQEIRDIVVNKTTGEVYVSGVFQYYFNINNVQQNASVYIQPWAVAGERSFVSKFDTNGNLVWSNNFSSNSEYPVNGCYSIAIAPDGNSVYVANGYLADVKLETGESYLPTGFGVQGYLLTRLSATTGGVLAVRNDIERYLVDGYILTCDNDGNVIFAGSHRRNCMNEVDVVAFPSCVANPAFGLPDGFIWKMDANFISQWGKEIRGTGFEIVSALGTDGQNNIYAYGTFSSMASFDASVLNPVALKSNAFLAKLTPTGTYSFVKGFNADQLAITVYPFDPEAPLAVDSKGNAFIGGNFTGTLNYQGNTIATEIASNAFYANGFLLKINNKGNIRWGEKYAGDIGPTSVTSVHGIATLGGYVSVCGKYASYAVYQGDSIFADAKAFFLSSLQDCDFTVSINATALLVNAANPVTLSTPNRPYYSYQWQRNNVDIPGANSNTLVTTLVGNYKCVVTYGSCVVSSKKIKLLFLREAGMSDNDALIVYPNPASTILNIELPTAQIGRDLNIVITDLSGRALFTGNYTSGEDGLITIQLNNQIASGVYLLQVSDANIVSSTSIVIE